MLDIEGFFRPGTSTISHLVSDRASRRAAIIDSVLDCDHASGSVTTGSADALLARAEAQQLVIDWILETRSTIGRRPARRASKPALHGPWRFAGSPLVSRRGRP